MEFTMQSGGVPAGSYSAQFVGADKFTDNADRFGEAVLLKWQVLDGPHAGEETTRIAAAKLTPKTALGKLATALLGRALETGERFDFATVIGVRGSVLVEPTESGGTRVATFLRLQPAGNGQPQQTEGSVSL